MTITLHWWFVPAALVVMAFVYALWPRRHHDWDFVSPIVSLGIFLTLLLVAGAFTLGHLFA